MSLSCFSSPAPQGGAESPLQADRAYHLPSHVLKHHFASLPLQDQVEYLSQVPLRGPGSFPPSPAHYPPPTSKGGGARAAGPPSGPHREETVIAKGEGQPLAEGTALLAQCCPRKPTVQKVRRPWGESGRADVPGGLEATGFPGAG